jgi:hypothetical protein
VHLSLASPESGFQERSNPSTAREAEEDMRDRNSGRGGRRKAIQIAIETTGQTKACVDIRTYVSAERQEE